MDTQNVFHLLTEPTPSSISTNTHKEIKFAKGLNPGLLNTSQILLPLSHQDSWVLEQRILLLV